MAERSETEKAEAASDRIDFPVTGMTCAACAARIERVLSKQKGIGSAAVNFAAARATVAYDPTVTTTADIAGAVSRIGYGTAGESEAEFVLEGSAPPPDLAAKFEQDLLRRKGILSASLNPATMTAAVGYLSETTDRDDIARSIGEFGFRVVSVSGDDEPADERLA
jgi:Cu+-exporting ATPase